MLKPIKSLLERNALLIAITITIAIAYLSLSHPIAIELPFKISFLDKIFHAIAYFVLSLSWLFALRNNTKPIFIVFGLFLYGVLMEFLQGWLTTYREEDFFDVVANSTGIAIALFIFIKFNKYINKMFD